MILHVAGAALFETKNEVANILDPKEVATVAEGARRDVANLRLRRLPLPGRATVRCMA